MELKELLPIIYPLIGLQLILQIIAVVDLSKRPAELLRGGQKVIWYLVVLVLGIPGALTYLFVGKQD